MQALRLDDFNVRILRALQDDGRYTNQELAERVGLSASQCSRRRRALEDTGIIQGYHASVSSEALGFEMMAFVQVHVATISANNNDIILKKIETFPEIVEAYSLTGIWDYILKVVVPSLTRFDEIINIAFGTPGSNLQVQSSFVLKRLKKSTRLPPSGPNAPGP